MSRTLRSLVAIALVIGIGLPLWLWVAREPEPPVVPPRDLGPVPVVFQPVEAQVLECTVEARGNVVPARRLALAFERAGRLASLAAWQPGAFVAEGDVIATLETERLGAARRSAAARLSEAQAARAASVVAERDARVALATAEEALSIARGEAERIAQLVERGSLAPSAGDRAGSQRLAARAAFERTEAELRQAQAALSLGDARLELARAALAEIDVELELSRLVAPFDGRLVGPAPTVGALVGPAVVLGELVGEEVVLRARVGELDLARLAIGQAALVRLPTLPETRPLASRRARVRAVDPLAEPLTRRALVELELDGPPPTAGSFGVATIVTGVLEDAVWVARRHLVWRDGRATAFVLVERAGETFAEQRVLDLSQDHGEGFVVSAGLSVGELLLIEPLDRLTDGIPVATP